MARSQGSFAWWATFGMALLISGPVLGQVVPGTGRKVQQFGDDFEDPNWAYRENGKKSSFEQDNRIRFPKGKSNNGRWVESTKRGHPDYIKRVKTPAGGLPGSKGALLLQSRDTGIPGRPSGRMQQDDFLAESYETSSANNPNYVVRVYLPPYDQWENRTGSSFGFRIGCRAPKVDKFGREKRGLFGIDWESFGNEEAYWPGMFIQFLSKDDPRHDKDKIQLVCRAGRTGREFPGMAMSPGWWTLGLSVSGDGAVHYYARKGVDRLTPNDRIGSSYPYHFQCERVVTMFFNICSADDGRTWSTPWVVDDPEMYLGTNGGVFMEARNFEPERPRSKGLLNRLFR